MDLSFNLEVNAHPDHIAYIKHLVKGSLRRLDPNAKIHCENIASQDYFETVEKDAYERGELSL